MSDTYLVFHDPDGLIEAELPLNRAPHEALVTAVLAWKDPDLAPGDYEQIAPPAHRDARAVAADVRRLAAALPKSDGRGTLAEVILREADGRLFAPLSGTARCVQNRARASWVTAMRHAAKTPARAPCWSPAGPAASWPPPAVPGCGSTREGPPPAPMPSPTARLPRPGTGRAQEPERRGRATTTGPGPRSAPTATGTC
ncbi:hypothetical protein STPH1_7433 [Streptomyces sp. OM5714]|nr:hypothetical protein STPH1_7433 [Streptomyces sp. OM5714]